MLACLQTMWNCCKAVFEFFCVCRCCNMTFWFCACVVATTMALLSGAAYIFRGFYTFSLWVIGYGMPDFSSEMQFLNICCAMSVLALIAALNTAIALIRLIRSIRIILIPIFRLPAIQYGAVPVEVREMTELLTQQYELLRSLVLAITAKN